MVITKKDGEQIISHGRSELTFTEKPIPAGHRRYVVVKVGPKKFEEIAMRDVLSIKGGRNALKT